MRSSSHFFEKLATTITRFTGSNTAFLSALTLVLVWLICGPIFDYSEYWQLIINTFTTIVTFLMVFLIQKSQNKDSLAMQVKLDELIAASDLASNRLVSAEDMSEEELKIIQRYYSRLSRLAQKTEVLTESHSIDKAKKRHDSKQRIRKKNAASRDCSINVSRKGKPSMKISEVSRSKINYS